jgi:Ca2+-transporting ATPase
MSCFVHAPFSKDGVANRQYPAQVSTTTAAAESLSNPKATSIHEEPGSIHLNNAEALTPDPRTIDMFRTENNKFAFSPGHLGKLINPKSLAAFYALGGLGGLERGLKADRSTGLSSDESSVDGSISFEDVVLPGTPKYGKHGDQLPDVTPSEEAGGHKHGKKNKKTKGADHIPAMPPIGHIDPNSVYADRRRIFRDNRLPEKKTKSLLRLILETWNDKVLILLTVAAVVSLALGLYETFGQEHEPGVPKVDWVEGVAIMVAVLIVVMVGSINDWQMERQFNRLNSKKEDRTVKMIRSGKSVEVSVFDVMVGDVMHLSTGDLVPVDGIFIDGHGLRADESSATGESDILRKVPADDVFKALEQLQQGKAEYSENELEKMDPFIISGSKVTEGTGTFLVTAVGVNSSYGRTTMALQTPASTTPLQQKLEGLSEAIAWFGLGAGLLLFIVLFILFLANLPHNTASAADKGKEFLDIFIVAVTIIVVAVPEGLPLAVTLALAYATTRMLKDQNLVRVLKACETMGNATTVCSDKTGTLTQNKMTVTAMALGTSTSFGGTDKPMDGSEPLETGIPTVGPAELVGGLSGELKRLLIQANAVNSTAFEGEQDGEHTFIGSKTEVALLTFSRDLLGAGLVQEERANAKVVQVLPFDSAVKYMATVVELPSKGFRAYFKGASEILVGKCTKQLVDPGSEQLGVTDLGSDDAGKLQIAIKSYASQTLRTIALSYRDFEAWPPEGAASKDDPRKADFTALHQDMTLVAIFGIKDPLRTTVQQAIKDCQRASVIVRMVTGDNISTGSAIAYECGIYHPEQGGIAMQGPDFRVLSEQQLMETVPNLQVLARSSPEDKRILVDFLKRRGETVAVTGDGTNDAPALKLADVGFSMGIAGTDVAKEASDIILMDDNFASIVKARHDRLFGANEWLS